MNTKFLQILVPVLTCAVFVFNYMAAAGAINGTLTADVSEKFDTVLTPAGYAFTIWTLIYVGMAAYSIFQLLPGNSSGENLSRTRIPYLLLCLANIAWLVSWHYYLLPLSLLIIAAMLLLLALINHHLSTAKSLGEKWAARIPFAIYFGWITVATIVNAFVVLKYSEIQLSESTETFIGIFAIIVAVVMGILVRFRIESMAFALTIAWGLTAIGVEQSGNTLVVLSTAIGMMALIFFALWGYVKDR